MLKKNKEVKQTMTNKLTQNQPKNNSNKNQTPNISTQVEEMGFPMQEEIDRLEEMILNNPRIPFFGRTLVDEDKLINQLDLIRINIPDSLEQALEVLQQKQQIINDAQQYGKKVLENAQKRAAQILDETRIIQQAEAQANKIRTQVQQECDNLQRKTLYEVEQMKRIVQQEIAKMRQEAMVESEDIHNQADDYADAVLFRLEKQLNDMLKIVHNGRQQLNQNPSPVINHGDNSKSLGNKKAS
jgi:F0F1-type ATP synthase membrane subunit b/b'